MSSSAKQAEHLPHRGEGVTWCPSPCNVWDSQFPISRTQRQAPTGLFVKAQFHRADHALLLPPPLPAWGPRAAQWKVGRGRDLDHIRQREAGREGFLKEPVPLRRGDRESQDTSPGVTGHRRRKVQGKPEPPVAVRKVTAKQPSSSPPASDGGLTTTPQTTGEEETWDPGEVQSWTSGPESSTTPHTGSLKSTFIHIKKKSQKNRERM